MSEWKPIETAPKDGTNILLYITNVGVVPAWWHNLGEWCVGTPAGALVWGDETDPLNDGEPTHWMPLPEPPE